MCNTTDGTDAKAEVFFESFATDHPGHGTGTDPNWFYYWSQIQIIKDLLASPTGIPLYNQATGKFNATPTKPVLKLVYWEPFSYVENFNSTGPSQPSSTGSNTVLGTTIDGEYVTGEYGESHFGSETWKSISLSGPGEVVIDYNGFSNALEIYIGKGCGKLKPINACVSGGFHSGIYVFYKTVAHEVEHVKIACDVWNFTHPSRPLEVAGCNSEWDIDHDGYKDIWENHDPMAMQYRFDQIIEPNGKNKDKYDPSYAHTSSSSSSCNLCLDPGKCSSAGTHYEERRCREVEAKLDLKVIKDYDWSFDATKVKYKYQGKRW
jgi:hypothetical protein